MDKIQIPLSKIIPWVGAIVITVVGATYTITRVATSDQVESLKTQLKAAEKANSNSITEGINIIPVPTIDAVENPESLNVLVTRITNLEKERQMLLGQLIDESQKALDPSSELAGLIAQLESDSRDKRKEAIEGLFVLADPRALPSMLIYLNKRREEATEFKYLFEWYDLFWSIDPNTGLAFAISEFESKDPSRTERAYNELFKVLSNETDAQYEPTIKRLETVAITNSNPLIRTRAKVLIERNRNSSDSDKSDFQTAYQSNAKPETVTLVFSIFNRNGISDKFDELVRNSGDITYWKTGYFLMRTYLIDSANKGKYIAALEMLVDQPMAPNSLAFNLYLLSKMEQLRGNKERANYWLNECRNRVPLVYDYLSEQDKTFDFNSFKLGIFK